ncbi:MAG: UvrD-helicase domain-containing protein [Leptospiraceae bacterium]|nr:UvrD-helicase domain-containing protein [Leptospiraceae bacterium]
MSPLSMANFKNLNPEQARAARHIEGPQLILAGAGSGKTTVITTRIAWLLHRGIAPTAIVAVTFTNKSAREMKQRLSRMLGKKALRGMVVSTFHSLGHRILKQHIETLGYRLPFSILSPEDLHNVMVDIYRELKLDISQIRDDGVLFKISLCKNSALSPHDFASQKMNLESTDLFCAIYERYHQSLKILNAVDFDDLILLPGKIFRQDPEILERYRHRWRFFMIDEYQDTNHSQYDFLNQMVCPRNNLCVVGDDDQSIYTWRGADINIILGFEKDYPNAQVVRLETNYRSTATILKAANQVIAHNSQRMAKTLRSVSGIGDKIKAIAAADEVREAALIAEQIRSLINGRRLEPGDIAILFRTNFQSRVFEQELRNRNIPHHVVGGYRFFDRREVRDMIAYLRVIANPHDELALSRIINRPRRGIGQGSLQKIMDYLLAQESESRPDLFSIMELIVHEPGLIPGLRKESISAIYEFSEFINEYRKRFSRANRLSVVLAQMISDLKFDLEFQRDGDNENTAKARMLNLGELVNMLAYLEDNWEENEPPDLFDFLARLSMQAQDNDEEHPRGRVQLLTLHLSKGLEYPVVFLSGIEEGLFPAPRTLEENGDLALAEERRLFYVGITRAKQLLYLSRAASRRKFGEHQIVEASRFWDELPQDCLEWIADETVEQNNNTRQNVLTDLLAAI